MVLSDDGRGWRKYFLVSWAFLECLLFAGILYGWGSLVFVLKDEGIYADLCDTESTIHDSSLNSPLDNDTLHNSTFTSNNNVDDIDTVNVLVERRGSINTSTSSNSTPSMNGSMAVGGIGCKAQDGRMTLCFTIGSAIFCASCFLMGHVNYKLGTRITRLTAIVFFVAGSLCLAFLNQDVPWLMYPGLTLIGVGGLPLLVTNTQVSNLFTKGSATVIGLLVGGYDTSSAVFLVIKLSYQRGISRQALYLGLTVMQLFTLISTFFFLPKRFIEKKELLQMIRAALDIDLGRKENKAKTPSLADVQPMKSYLKQPLFITHNIWLCLLQLRFYFLMGSLNPYLNRTLKGDKQLVSYFTDICFYTMMGGLVTSFLVGIVYDWQKRIFSGEHHSKLYRSLMPAIFPLSLASVFAIIFSVLVLVPVQPLFYVIFVVMVLCRSFLYSMAVAFISAIFPIQYFGLLYGLTMFNAGLFSCLQYAFFEWTEAYENGPFHADIALLCVAIVSLGHPIYMYICARRAESEYKALLGSKPRKSREVSDVFGVTNPSFSG